MYIGAQLRAKRSVQAGINLFVVIKGIEDQNSFWRISQHLEPFPKCLPSGQQRQRREVQIAPRKCFADEETLLISRKHLLFRECQTHHTAGSAKFRAGFKQFPGARGY